MNPRTVTGQLLALVLVAAATAQSRVWWCGAALLGVVTACWFLLRWAYQRRRTAIPEALRLAGDDRMSSLLVVAAAAVGVTSVLGLGGISGELPEYLAVPLVAVCTVLAVIVVSSLIDWYWILPRTTGLVGGGVCAGDSDRNAWLILTKQRLLHRFFADACFVLGALAVWTAGVAALSGDWHVGLLSLGGIGLSLGISAFLQRLLGDVAQTSSSVLRQLIVLAGILEGPALAARWLARDTPPFAFGDVWEKSGERWVVSDIDMGGVLVRALDERPADAGDPVIVRWGRLKRLEADIQDGHLRRLGHISQAQWGSRCLDNGCMRWMDSSSCRCVAAHGAGKASPHG